MCGIAGFVGFPGDLEERSSRLVSMTRTLRHRGPDDDGHHLEGPVALGMRRLSIIDVEGGKQPISSEDGQVTVVFNGEIYNHGELRRKLEASGHQFRTRSDTEILVHLYEEEGESLVDKLRGMFAFALWDASRRRLVLVRDRLGIKPLFYTEQPVGMAFGSELRALRPVLPPESTINLRSLGLYLSLGYVPDPDCIFEGVRKLPPGHGLTWTEEEGIRLWRYWSPVRPELSVSDDREAVEELQRLLDQAVRYRLIADVPLGAFLSGGLDSSAVVALMARAMDRPVRTFSIGFDEPGYNEAPDAARVAKALGTDHTELMVEPDAEVLFGTVVGAFDEPFSDSSAIPTYLVSRLAREQVKVCLSGDGGDELFGGYTRYHDTLNEWSAPGRATRAALGLLGRGLPQAAYGRNRLLHLSRSPRGRYAGTVASPLRRSEGGIARKAVAQQVPGLEQLLDPWFEAAACRDFPTQLTLVDAQTYLPGDILTKVDRMSMAVSLEARVPLLDHELAEFAFSLPSRLKFGHPQGKSIFRTAIEQLVPDSVLRKEKSGFAVPLERWLRKELGHLTEELLIESSDLFDFVEPDAVRRVVDEHRRGRRDHAHLLWRLFVLGGWLEQWTRKTTAHPLEPLRLRAEVPS